MKKSSVLFMLLSISVSVFAFYPGFCSAQSKTAEAEKNSSNNAQMSVSAGQYETAPVQVNVQINNSAEANGNTQTAAISNSLPQSVGQTAIPAATAPVHAPSGYVSGDTKRLSGKDTLYGEYFYSPYQSKLQTEMLRHTVWGSLVPRKKIYSDPALGKYPLRYSTVKNSPCPENPASKSADKINDVSKTEKKQAGVSVVEKSNLNKTGQNVSSFYEPLNKVGSDASVSSARPQPNADSLQKKVEGIQDALLIPKL